MESYPPDGVTKYGIELLKEGIEPHITYISPDRDIAFYLNGGLAPWPGVTEGVVLADGVMGLHAPFNHLDHKGARQNGATWVDTVYDAAEIDMQVICTGRTPEGLRAVIRKWFASWDPEKRGTLSWVTPDGGEWWCHPRLFRAPQDRTARTMARSREQAFQWVIRNDDAFWRSHDSVGQFVPAYERAKDNFNRDDPGTLGPHWKQTYQGPGSGVCETDKSTNFSPGRAIWTANDPDTYFTGTRRVVIGPYKGYTSPTDDVDVSIVFNNTPEYTPGTGAANDLWARMGRNGDGTWDGSGIRARIGWGYVRISYFKDFVETVIRQEFEQFPPTRGETFLLRCVGRSYQLFRKNNFGTFSIISHNESGTDSFMDTSHRGVGFGLQGGGAILTQATPASIRSISSGTMVDSFNYSTTTGLGANWPLYYTGVTTGYVRANGDRAVWIDTAPGRKVRNRWLGSSATQTVTVNGAPTTWRLAYKGSPTPSIAHPATTTAVRTALEALPQINPGDVAVSGPTGGPYVIDFQGALASDDIDTLTGSVISGGTNPFIQVATTAAGQPRTTATDYQVISLRLGDLFEFPFPDAAYIDIWGRLDTNDDNPTGIRLRIGPQWVRLSRFNNGVEAVMRQRPLLLLPLWNEKWTLECGSGSKVRRFKVKRGDFTVLDYTESGTGSAVGANYRGGGFGMESGDGTFHQRIPPSILDWSMGDNGSVTQSGHITLTNIGDQDVYPDYVVQGPGTFRFADGPGREPTVEFGPLADGQTALIKTHPGQRAVYDITSEQSEQDLPQFQEFFKRLFSLAFNNNLPPLTKWLQSMFGITPQQGPLYSRLKGRFSRPIPARPVAGGPVTSQIAVEIKGGNADSRIVGAITPLRRWPE